MSDLEQKLADSLVEVNPELARKYIASRFPELRIAGFAMQQFLEEHALPTEGTQSISIGALERAADD